MIACEEVYCDVLADQWRRIFVGTKCQPGSAVHDRGLNARTELKVHAIGGNPTVWKICGEMCDLIEEIRLRSALGSMPQQAGPAS